jgi:hypothetical protein
LTAVVVAHAGHRLEAIGFALAPLIVIAGIAAIAISERRRGRQH